MMFKMLTTDYRAQITHPVMPGDVGYDLKSAKYTVLKAGELSYVDTGVAVKIPDGHWAMIIGRSSLTRDYSIIVPTNVIDGGFTGVLRVPCLPTEGPVAIAAGQRIAQLVLFPAVTPILVRVDELPETVRGSNGFGSTGQ